MCWTTAKMLNLEGLTPESFKIDNDLYWCLDRSKMSFAQIMSINKELLSHIFLECNILECMEAPKFLDDPLTRGLRTFHRNQQKSPISIALVFSAQMVLCANTLLGTEGTRPLEDMQAAARQAEALISKYEDAGLHQVDNSSTQTLGIVRCLRRAILQLMLDDHYAKLNVEFLKSKNFIFNGVLSTRPFHLFKLNPLACGRRLLYLEVIMKGWGSLVGQNYATCIQTAHLYHAVRLMEPIDVRWPEMDSFLSLHSADLLFAGKIPTTMEECLTR